MACLDMPSKILCCPVLGMSVQNIYSVNMGLKDGSQCVMSIT